jgi:hypothetical protein
MTLLLRIDVTYDGRKVFTHLNSAGFWSRTLQLPPAHWSHVNHVSSPSNYDLLRLAVSGLDHVVGQMSLQGRVVAEMAEEAALFDPLDVIEQGMLEQDEIGGFPPDRG